MLHCIAASPSPPLAANTSHPATPLHMLTLRALVGFNLSLDPSPPQVFDMLTRTAEELDVLQGEMEALRAQKPAG